MKEFTSQTGGRYTYVDDLINLQDLALAFASIFDGCDNFVISGCTVSGTSISAGYVYINGKIRYCSGASGVSKWPMYIYENNSVDSVPYADSSDKVGRNIYGCAVASSVPTTQDTLTGALPQSIKIASDGTAIRLKDALFGKYALMIDSPYSSQTVAKDVVFEGTVTMEGTANVKTLNIVNGTAKGTVSYDASGNLTVLSTPTSSKQYKLTMSADGDFSFYNGSTLLATLNSAGLVLKVSLSTDVVGAGNIVVKSDNIYNGGTGTDSGTLNINVLGYNGGATYYRNTIIGNGKGEAVLEIMGSTRTSAFYGPVTVNNANSYPLILKHTGLAKTDKTLLSSVAWYDKNDAQMGYVGYTDSSTYDLYIKNNIGNVIVQNDVYVTGKLYVGGEEVLGGNKETTKDTGWLTMSVLNCGITTKLYVRQIGNVVSIQGQLHTHHSGTIFTLPNSIDPPPYEIGYSHNRYGHWHCIIAGGSRDCKVDYCSSGCSEYIGFLMTYMV